MYDGRTAEEHDQRLDKVLQRLQEAGLTLNEQKCRFSQSQVQFLGQVVDRDGIHLNPEKVRAIREVRPPKNVSDVQRFLGMSNTLPSSPQFGREDEAIAGVVD